MIDLLSYIVREVKSGRLKKGAAAALLSQMRSQNSVGPIGTFLTVKLDGVLHPLLQSNTSDLSEQRFSSTFIGDEFFLSDHVVRGSKVLPGVCYLEMARAAVAASALEAGEDERVSIVLKNVVWAQPVVVDECTEIHLGVYPDEQGELAYEIYSATGEEVENEGESERVIHSQGYARIEAKCEAERLDLSVLRQGCDQRIEVSECYAAFSALGLKYGPAHRGLTSIQSGVDSKGGRYVLAQVQLPECVSETQGGYNLHPSVLDSALQASVGLALQSKRFGMSESGSKPRLPFALESLEMFERSPARGYVYVRLSGEESQRDAVTFEKLDIDVCDETGRVCVRLKGFTSRVLEGDLPIGAVRTTTAEREGSATGAMHLVPRWEVVTVSLGKRWPSTESKGVVIGGSVEQQHALRTHYPTLQVLTLGAQDSVDRIAEQLQAQGEIEHILWLTPPSQIMESTAVTDERLISEQAVGVVSGFRLIKALLQLGYGSRALGLSVVTWQTQAIDEHERIDPTHASIHGFIGSLAKEYAQWNIRLVDLPIEGEWPLEAVLRLPADAKGDAWAYRSGEWYRQQLVPCTMQESTAPSFRQGGVYVVIGGAGGIGEVFSEYLIRKYQAQVIWIGRRECDAGIQAKLNRLATLGPLPTYLCADARDRKAMEHTYQEIKTRHPQIHGLVHSAIALLDKSLANMEEERFTAGLSAKVDISVRLAQVFASESLECVLFFSAMQSFMKAPGQSNYAAGCTFKDAYANALSKVWRCSIKVMNWGYWGSVGVVATEAHRARMAQRGVGSIEPEDGMRAIEALLGSSFNQLGYVKTVNPAAMEDRASQECIVSLPVTLPVMNEAELLRRTALVSTAGMRVRVQHSAYGQFEDLLVILLGVQLRTLGLFPEGWGGAQNNAAIETWKQIQLPESYGRWLTQSLRVLTEHGYLGQDNEVMMSASATLTSEEVWSQWEAQTPRWREDPSLRAQVNLVEATLRALPEILTGKKPATEVMFPNSSMALVEGIYKDQPIADYFNAVLVEALVDYIEDRLRAEPSARIRILEIGAGTGGTSARVFTALRPYLAQIDEYCYTDVSKAFLLHAEQAYGASAPYLNYRLFNVEHSLASQGIAIGRYDVVIATNVLHATRDIKATVRNAKAALKGHGLLLLNEISQPSVFAHLTFGLLEGWWLYEDAVLRIPGTPALEPAQWQRVLHDEGFRRVLFPAEAAQVYGQQVIIAQSDGVVRQPHSSKPASMPTRALARSSPSSLSVSVVDPLGPPAPASLGTLREKATAALKRLVGQVLQIPVQQLDASEPLEKYGVDSILVVKMTGVINTVFSHVASTVFFEYRTLAALADHLITTQPEAALRWVGLEERLSAPALRAEGAERRESSVPKLPQGRRARRYGLRSPQGISGGVSERSGSAGVREAIAIIGLSGRYPQANTVDEFWEHLKAGKACIREIPADRWDWRAYYSEEKGKPGSMYSKWGGFMEEIAGFDPLFFHLSPREAERMDPQERLFLQEAYASIEDAGYAPKNLSTDKQVGVYVGVMNSTYHRSPSYWSVANRVSYLMDFQGPSLAVDTACSSSLTAIHLAVESLRSGQCQCALAGGVNLIVDPIQYLGLSAMTMLSSGPECKSFGDQADGFVDGEGVGVIVLKRLSQAIADHDHIYGVIKGSALNAGGKTHGYTVPNVSAQAQVIAHALKDAQVDARTISYIEAHGTGTSLGDPIEIAGLKKAFGESTQDTQYCALGSAKSNIGHLESAAGIAGLTKVLLQFKHQMLVPSLHSEVLNPQIDFASTPFKVQQSLTAWPRPRIAMNHLEEKEYPRIAGISSFGAGGANAHVIVEEYCVPPSAIDPSMVIDADHPALIVLSAKSEERLQERVAQLLAYVSIHSLSDADLVNLAYTLQVGREAMEHRLAFTVVTLKDLQTKLSGYLEGKVEKGAIDDFYCGDTKKNKEALSGLNADEDVGSLINLWMEKGKYLKLIEQWVKGLSLDWERLYATGASHGPWHPTRLSLPTYPFAKERYWVEVSAASSAQRDGARAVLHPLLHRNTSDLNEQRFTSDLTGEELFLSAYLVADRKVLPEVAYLEMARAAVSASLGDESVSAVDIVFKDVVWLRPVVVGDVPVSVHIGVYAQGDGEMEFEVYTGGQSTEDGVGFLSVQDTREEVLHAQGRAVLSTALSQQEAEQKIDVAALRGQCDQSIEIEQCYAAFSAMGLEYGAAHRGLTSVQIGSDTDGQRFVLAQVILPACVSDTADPYVLHPSVLDNALQASMGLSLNQPTIVSSERELKPSVPFALERLEIFARSPAVAWVVVRPSDSRSASIVSTVTPPTPATAASLQKLDIDLCDESGRVCVRMRGFTSRVLEAELRSAASLKASDAQIEQSESVATTLVPLTGGVLLAPHWEAVTPQWTIEQSATGSTALKDSSSLLMVGGTTAQQHAWRERYPSLQVIAIEGDTSIEEIAARIQAVGRIEEVVWLSPLSSDSMTAVACVTEEALIQAQALGVLSLYRLIKALLSQGYDAREVGFSVVTWQTQAVIRGERIDSTHAGVHGLIGSLAKEYAGWQIRLVDLPRRSATHGDIADLHPLIDAMRRLPADPRGNAWAYRAGEWYQQHLVSCELPTSQTDRYRAGGVYVVIGGGGGLGEAFSEHLIRHYQAHLIWIGRRAVDAGIHAKIERLSTLGPAPRYLQADATDRDSLAQAYQTIKAQHGQIHGLVHAAIALLDKSLAQMDEARFKASLAAKVDVSVRMAQVFAPEPLDFVLFFSSLQSFTKAAGQSNYAAGCTFKDAFAYQLGHAWSCPVKVMNWGYWGSVGIVASDLYRARMAQQGIGSIEPEEGMKVLTQLLSSGLSQVAFLKTTSSQKLSVIGEVRERISFATLSVPSPTEPLAHRGERVFAQDATDAQGVEARNDLPHWLGRLLFSQLQSLDLFVTAHPSIPAWQQQINLPALYGRWLEESVRVLASLGYLTLANTNCSVVDATRLDNAALWSEWDQKKKAWLQDPNIGAQVRLVDATLRALPDILTGKKPATDILFPNASMALVEGIYKNNSVSDYFNAVLADTLVAFIEARSQQNPLARIRILEIGAGTGGTSEGVFKRLKPYEESIAEYCYTDLSKAFLLHAQERYAADNPYLITKIFNVEQPLRPQEIEIGAYDVVIASNVLHATKHIRHTLCNAKAALKENGVLLLNEVVSNTLFAHLTFGLLEGWWKYEDVALRIQGGPALSSNTWQRILHEEGLHSIQYPARADEALGQQIIVAESDGVIRQQAQSVSDSRKDRASRDDTPLVHAPIARGKSVAATAVKERSYRGEILPSNRSGRTLTDDLMREKTKQIIAEQLSASLKVDLESIDADESFASYGLDSIMGVRTVDALNQRLSIKLTTTSLYDYPSVNKLSAHVVVEYRDIIVAQIGGDAQGSDQTQALPSSLAQPIIRADQLQQKNTSLRQRLGRVRHSRRSKLPGSIEVHSTRSTQVDRDRGALLREPIAIIGLSGRYPRSENVHELWTHLAHSVELIEDVRRWDLTQAYTDLRVQDGCRRGGFLTDIDLFDPLFFNISGIEATYMDPQQRLFLEESWKTLEDAGYAGASIEGRQCGVYVGYNGSDYQQLFGGDTLPAQAMWGGAASILSARIAYYLDLKGPAITIDTACSSSLVALHLACQGLRTGEIDFALAGGVFVQCTPGFYVSATRAGMLSPHGRCYTFDDRADGFVPGEGVGVVLLKRLSDAMTDHDHVHAVIRGSGINQDGATNGITAPSALSQERLERDVYESFGIHAEEIQLVEAHGTGTKLGDPIEFQALTKAFRKDTDKQHFCAIGSIKTNIGHTTAASGIAGVIKTVLALTHKQLPPSLHFEKGNAHIEFETSPFYVNTRLRTWDIEAGKKRCAAVSAFGMSGTNAHVVLEEATVSERALVGRPGSLIVLSARTAEQLKEQVVRLLAHCEHAEINCNDISYTLMLGRKHFQHRLACVASDAAELVTKLQGFLKTGKSTPSLFLSLLQEQSQREQTALKHYGNQCIEECGYAEQTSGYIERLTAIASLYCQGYELNFKALYEGMDCSRISLPTYPFARERHWIEGSPFQKLRSVTERHDINSTGLSDVLDALMADELNIYDAIDKAREMLGEKV